MTKGTWQSILPEHYGIEDGELVGEISSHNLHYRISSKVTGGQLLLSRRSIPGGAARFRFTQALLNDLQSQLETLQRSRRTNQGLSYVAGSGHYWQLVDFIDADGANWTDPELIRDSARRLAEFHTASATLPTNFPLAQNDLASFEWSMHEWNKSLDGYVKSFIRSGKYDEETVRDVRNFAGRHQALAADCVDLVEMQGLFGLTHQDYRPANLCVVDGAVKYIWDWDLARNDVILYDVAFAALQFGDREVVFPNFRPDLAMMFVAEYASARNLSSTDERFGRILSWCFGAVVLKRLLNGWHVESRRQVLRELIEAGLLRF